METPKFNNIENKKYTVKNDEGKDITIYHNRAVTVNIVQFAAVPSNQDGVADLYVLVAERGPKAHDYNGMLNLPCGHLDWNENAIEAGTREMYEETGLFNPNLQVEGVNSDPGNNRQNVEILLAGLLEANSISELPALKTDPEDISNSESINAKWMSVNDVVEIFDRTMTGEQASPFAFGHEILVIELVKKYFIGNDGSGSEEIEQI